MPTQRAASTRSGPRARILDTAYELFAHRGIRDVSVNEIIDAASVAKATFYRHYRSKDVLVVAFLAERERRWTFAMVEAESRARGDGPLEQLVAIFDVFGDWFARAEFEGCSFINVLVELGPEHPAGQASIDHLRTIRTMVRERATRGGLHDPDGFARSFHILMKGSIISATEGDAAAGERAGQMARTLIAAHRR